MNTDEEIEAMVKVWMEAFDKKHHKENHAQFYQLIYGNAKATQIFLNLMKSKQESESQHEEITNKSALEISATKVKDIDRLLARLSNWMENNDVNDCLADVWDLQEYKLMMNQSKMEALKEALKAADDQLVQQKSLNTQLELEVRNYELSREKLESGQEMRGKFEFVLLINM